MRQLQRAWSWVGHSLTAWGLLPSSWWTAASAGLSVVTGYLGLPEVGWAWAIFLATGVFAFAMLGIYYAMVMSRKMTVFQHLIVREVSIADGGVRSNDDNSISLTHITLQCVLKNESERTMFLRAKRIHHSYQPAEVMTDGMAGSAAFPTPSLRVSSSGSTS